MPFNTTIYQDEYFGDGTTFWNITANVTSTILKERPQWMNVLDKVSAIIMTCNLVALMLGMGAATYLTEVWMNIKRPYGSLIGMVCQFGFLPAIGFGISVAMQLSPYQALSVLIVTCSPGGAMSNFFTYWVDGDIALSILMTATSSLLAFGGMPFNIWLYTQYWTDDVLVIPYLNVLVSVCFVTGPAIIGMTIRHYSKVWGNRISKFCAVLGWIGALSCGVIIFVVYWQVIIAVSGSMLITAASIPVAGFTIAYITAKTFRLSHKVCRTIGIETGCQNMAVAINVMLLSYSDPQIRGEMITFPTIYGGFQTVEIFIAIIAFQIHKFIHRTDVAGEVKTTPNSATPNIVTFPNQRNDYKPVNLEKEGHGIYSNGHLTDLLAKDQTSIQRKFEETEPFLKDWNDHFLDKGTKVASLPEVILEGSGASERRFNDQMMNSSKEEKTEPSNNTIDLMLLPSGTIDASKEFYFTNNSQSKGSYSAIPRSQSVNNFYSSVQ